jgi:peptide/nickel transport system permease protein
MNYYIKRTFQAVFTVWATLSFTFVLTRWMPGGPLDYIKAQMALGNLGPGSGGGGGSGSVDMAQFSQLAQDYVGIDPSKPIYLQYAEYMVGLLQGDLGQSIWYGEPVSQVLFPAIPWTVFLGSIAVTVSFTTRVVLGALLAYLEGSKLDLGGTTALIWGHSIPFYIIAIVLIYVFAYQYGWFPISGRVNADATPGFNLPFIQGILWHATLPIISLVWVSFGQGALAMRANSIQVLGEDYLRAARLRGIDADRIALLYVGRNAILPMYTQMLIQIAFVFAGSVYLESIFAYPGVGYYLFQGIQARDYPLMMGAFILITITVVVAMYVADLTYSFLDPRIKQGDASEAY